MVWKYPLVHYFKNRSYRAVLGMHHWSLRIISGCLWESWGHETCNIILVLLASRNIPSKIVDHLYDIGGADFVCISNCSMQFLYITHDMTNHYIQLSVQCLLCFLYNNTPILQSVKMKVISKL